MIKIIAIGIWVCIAALGSSYFTASMSSASATTDAEDHKKEPTYFAGLDYKKTDSIAVPIVGADRIAGYVLATFVYTIDGEIANGLAVPPDPFILDEAFRAVYGVSGFDFHHPERYDLAALTSSIRDAVNARYHKELVHEILVQQFDFLPKNGSGGEAFKAAKG